ncbi:hypothetical protein L9F63_000949, partial [Diploptera punctata]
LLISKLTYSLNSLLSKTYSIFLTNYLNFNIRIFYYDASFKTILKIKLNRININIEAVVLRLEVPRQMQSPKRRGTSSLKTTAYSPESFKIIFIINQILKLVESIPLCFIMLYFFK